MEKAKINPFQLFVLIVLFELGSAIVLAIGIDAKQGAWISILLGLAAGLVAFFIYYRLYKQFPDLPLTGYLQKVLGRYIGTVVGFLYVIYFLYIAARVLRDFGDLLVSSTLPETPLFVVNLLMICAIVYVLYLGVEVLARSGEFFLMILLIIGTIANLLIVFAGIIDLNNLLPITGEGWSVILSTTFPAVFTFPFGEVVVFTMLLPYLNQQKVVFKVGASALLFSGLLLAFTTSMNIAVLGPDIASRSIFPLLTAVGKIRVADFLERLDALVVVTLIVGMFFKIAIFTYAGIVGLTFLFRLDTYQKLVLPIGLIVLFSSISMAKNFPEHLEEGLKIVPYFLHLPFQVFIPIALLLILFIRKKFFSFS